jgi:hypothetical protein
MMLCAEHDLLRQEHQATVANFREAIQDLVGLVDNSAADLNLTSAHWRIRATRGACEIAQAALEHHREQHECQNSSSPLPKTR